MKSLSQAFSLLELLLVMAVVGILAAFITPAIGSMVQFSNMTRAGQMLSDQIGLARQTASTRSETVEIRLIRLPNRSANGYHALQLWGLKPDGTSIAMGRLQRFPEGTMISADASTFSPMFALLGSGGTMTVGDAVNAAYVAFRIRPSGMVVPSGSPETRRNLSLSVTPENTGSNPPKNFVAIQINPDTGSTTIFRPE